MQNFQRSNGLPVQEFAPLSGTVDKVLKTGDAYSVIGDIAEEGIETGFVVPAALLLVRDAMGAEDGVAHIVTESLRIGGDRDTICSIAMGLYGLSSEAQARERLAGLIIGR